MAQSRLFPRGGFGRSFLRRHLTRVRRPVEGSGLPLFALDGTWTGLRSVGDWHRSRAEPAPGFRGPVQETVTVELLHGDRRDPGSPCLSVEVGRGEELMHRSVSDLLGIPFYWEESLGDQPEHAVENARGLVADEAGQRTINIVDQVQVVDYLRLGAYQAASATMDSASITIRARRWPDLGGTSLVLVTDLEPYLQTVRTMLINGLEGPANPR